MARFRIMSFDGGGIRGALTAAIVRRLYAEFHRLIEKTDLFVGTSTGSFIAAGLAFGLSPGEVAELYSEKNGKLIFAPGRLGLIRPKYNDKNLKRLLESVFPPDLRLDELPRRVLIPSFRVNSEAGWGPVFFHNFPGSPTGHVSTLDALLASSAAPVYFPSYRQHVDGGVVANNPSTASVAAAVDAAAGGRNLEDIVLLSIGTGLSPAAIKADTAKWGALQWVFYPSPPLPLLTIMLEGVAEVDTRFTSQLLGERHFRLNPVLPAPVALDDYEKIPELIAVAERADLEPAFQWIREYW